MAYAQTLSAWRRACVRMAQAALAAAALASAGAASAGYVSFDDAAMDAIFSQSSFGQFDIDIRFNAPLSVVAPSLVSIDSDAEFSDNDLSTLSLNDLSRQLGVPNFTVSIFFVDTITYCGGPGSNIIGCASQPGGLVALDSAAAAGSRGAVLMAHELAHNLGLPHLMSSSNLMNPQITGAFALTTTQIGSFLDLTTGVSSSPIVRNDAGQLYIAITPIAVLAAVPEPASWAMLSLGLLAVAGRARRRRRECVA